MDVVITYVDNTDKIWYETLMEYSTDIPKDADARYRSWNNLKYCLRSIEKNAPFIRKVHLIVSGPSQVPNWINKEEVNIVYHKDIIPEEYLPTFNSRTIEMCMHNIKDLDEEFIYFNDDMFIINKCEPDSFFVNGKPRNILKQYTEETFGNVSKHPVYEIPYKRCTTDAAKLLGITTDKYYFSNHGPNPLLKSVCKKVYDELGDNLLNSFTKFRSQDNYVHFIYSIYQLLGGYTSYKCLSNKWISSYSGLTKFYESMRLISETCLCINDTISKDISADVVMRLSEEILDMRFPNISKYENPIKVGLCVIVKNENLYLKQYVEHYKSLGFCKIYLYDNNDIDGENPKDVLSDYINTGFVVYKDYRGQTICQLKAYNDCYKTYSNDCDWIAFFDADEFLELWRHSNIQSFVNQSIFDKYNCIKVNWMIYGDNEQIYYENKPIRDRFPFPVIKDNNYYMGVNPNYYVKSIVKTDNTKLDWSCSPHIPDGVVCCNSLGKPSLLTIWSKPVYNDIVLKHYITKSVEEYISKVKRGYPDQLVKTGKRIGLLKKFFTINTYSAKKAEYIDNEINKATDKIYDNNYEYKIEY